MKQFLFSTLLSFLALNATAQGIIAKAMVIYKTDGTQDTILWKDAWGYSYDTYFYGKENPVDDDYVQLHFSISDDYQMSYGAYLTTVGKRAPYQWFGILISTEHINSVPYEKIKLHSPYDLERSVFFVDKNDFIWPDKETGTGADETYKMSAERVKSLFLFEPGQIFYVRAYYILDDETYFSTELEAHAPKTKSIMHELVYRDYCEFNDSIVFNVDSAIVKNNSEIFADGSTYKHKLFMQYVKKVLSVIGTEAIIEMASKIETCDDGLLYIIDDIPSYVTDEALLIIKNEIIQPFYVQANLDNLYIGVQNVYEFGTYKCFPTIVEVEEKWGIRGNRYLVTPPDGTTGKPCLALMLNHLMQSGKMYDITLTLAPNVQDETDSLNVYFYVCIADQKDDGTMPKLAESRSFPFDTITGNHGEFIAKPNELTDITMQYTPANFTTMHVLQLCHTKSFTTSANRKKYGQMFRIVGIEVKPH